MHPVTVILQLNHTLVKYVDSKGPKQHKTFFMLNSTEQIYSAHYNVNMPTMVGILTFISMINATSERHKARNFLFVGIKVIRSS